MKNYLHKISSKKLYLLLLVCSICMMNFSYSQSSSSLNNLISNTIKPNKYPTVNEAFNISASIIKNNKIELIISAIPNTYIYQNSFKFSSENKEIILSKPDFAGSKTIDDEHYGKTQVFFNKNIITIPYEAKSNTEFELIVKYQGCAR